MPYDDLDRPRAAPGAGFVLALAAGLVAVGAGASVATRRRDAQRRRAAAHPDDAPETARRSPATDSTLVASAVTIRKPRHELYAFWRDFANLPRFMSDVARVVEDGAGRSVWTIAAPGGFTVDLRTEITEDRPGETIAWRSLPDSDVRTAGRVRFADAPAGRGTVVTAEIAYDPPAGDVGRWIAKLFGREPRIQGRRELKRFKMLMEAGEIAVSANRKQTEGA